MQFGTIAALTAMSVPTLAGQARKAAPANPHPPAAKPAVTPSLTPAEIARAAIPSIVLIRTPTGLGSGFFAGGDGRIVTNYHVIRGSTEAIVVTADRAEHKDVTVVAVDKALDLAILHIGGGDHKPLPLGDSRTAAVGERVVAIGNPLGLGDTISDGLLSGTREFDGKVSVLQISAPISPGSSGGPVLDDRGQVIGIATFIVTSGQNLNFAVPIEAAKSMLSRTGGKPLSAFLEPGQVRHIPHLSVSILKGCSAPGLLATYDAIERAINLGAPLYNEGNHEATYRIYAGAAREVETTVSGCAGPKAALATGVANAGTLPDWSAKAWAMRDAFDGLIALLHPADPVSNSANVPGSTREKPVLSAGALAGCDAPDLTAMARAIRAAVEVGAPLYDGGNAEAAYRIYSGTIAELDRQPAKCPAAIAFLDRGQRDADHQNAAADKAGSLRDAFDAVTDAISNSAALHPAKR